MRSVTILLGILIIVLGLVFLQQRQSAQDELAVACQQTETVKRTLQAARSELTAYKAEQAAVVNQLQQQVASQSVAKAAAEEQAQQSRQQAETLKQTLAAAQKTVAAQQDQLAALESEKQKLLAGSAGLAEQLRAAKQQLAAPDKAPVTPAAAPPIIIREPASPELATLKARWNDLAALEARVKELKQKRAASATGNRGVLLHDGRWQTVKPPR